MREGKARRIATVWVSFRGYPAGAGRSRQIAGSFEPVRDEDVTSVELCLDRRAAGARKVEFVIGKLMSRRRISLSSPIRIWSFWKSGVGGGTANDFDRN